MKMKKAWCIALAAAMTFMSVMPAFAADTKIDTVKLTFSLTFSFFSFVRSELSLKPAHHSAASGCSAL